MIMKRVLLITGVILVLTTVTGQAQEIKISRAGIHGAYSVGGDIEESKAGFGAQAELAITPNFSVELALSRFSDEYDDSLITIDVDYTTIGLSAVYRAPLCEAAQGYLLSGFDYNITDADFSYNPEAFNVNVNADIDVDNKVGFHVGAGLNCAINSNWELFTEYRYTFLDIDVNTEISAGGNTENVSDSGSADFGLLKIGVNYLF